ncbi:OmpA family protein [Flavobacterium urocaniciphilum]|uniref:Outer membrane protein OmpA n=1 Tax=Flavobacterium urocaniciphilum TaxID=1299341 RepID=A0A1H9CQS0_9FLAO|nr:OmpA family protein [Flavobacterium urocaniciphilum]SEQ02943.1 Outer membrane protein OmpA [Flavobacterium urocaniciphilum]
MKKTYITLGLILLSGIAVSQNTAVQKANQLFESYQYVGAIESYLQAINNKQGNQQVYQNLADSYYHIYNTTEAAKWYEKAMQGDVNPESIFKYAQVLKSLGKYAEANVQMNKFSNLLPNDVRAKEFNKNQNYKTTLDNAKALFTVTNTNIAANKSNDFGPVLTNNNELYFVSTRNTTKVDKWSNVPYIDIFRATKNDDGTFSKAEEVKELNSAFHDGPVAISDDGNTMFFARDGHSTKMYEKDTKNNVKVGQLGIYRAIKVNGKWEIKEALPVNSTSYSVSHPSLSKDGKTLYFTSNMPGGIGESDIWKIAITENGYGKPENLGTKVNTPSREAFPFISDGNELYFASTGWPGLGGLDVFKIDLNKTSSSIINVGKPVNTENDDFSFSFNSKQKVAFFASNRNGTDAIFQASPICGTDLIPFITDSKTGKAIENATVTILNDKNEVVSTLETNNLGKTLYQMNCDNSYSIQVSALNYQKVSYPISRSSESQLELPIQLVPNEIIITDKEVLLGDVYFEFDKSNITPSGAIQLDKLVTIMNENPSMVIAVKSHTDSKGNAKYNLKLSEQRAQSTVQYLISRGIKKERISGKGFGNTEPKIKCGGNCTDEENAINRRSEFIIMKK